MAEIFTSAAIICLAAGLLLHVRRTHRLEQRLEQRLAQLAAEREALQARLDTLAATLEQSSLDAAALRISTLGLGAQIERLERAQNLLEAQLGRLERGAAQAASYAQAIRQAARGHVGVEELVKDFGLPRGEAELLLRMHRREGEEGGQAPRMNPSR